MSKPLPKKFFHQDAQILAKQLIGKVMRSKYHDMWLSAQIIETEAYYLADKSSHASLGFTEKRSALFMPAGTIYMYYSRAGDSLNISCKGKGNAVLVKSAVPYFDDNAQMIEMMRQLNPAKNGVRSINKLCAGQTLLCRALNLKVKEWDQQPFDPKRFFIEDVGYQPNTLIQTTRLGIPEGRDEDLPYRFIDYDYVDSCTSNPLRKKKEVFWTLIPASDL
ncbi:MAG: DNA-3-methyladenine glycosylase [Gammaproteobacteria bacterium]|nr:DNA-3-methyladenine glycosylase [Gammaproteobacteria bacterium]MBU1926977.1 DNA-3-methyladenine glycosylase [Gammaproteobacteria bacterium]MBU2545584.1 DNA-3-methyladenine glycosylase [Gammaproteobacteria bacterium]